MARSGPAVTQERRSSVVQVSRIGVIFALTLGIALRVGPVDAAAHGPIEGRVGRSIIDINGDRLSVTLHQEAVSETLQAIAERTGFRLVMSSAPDGRLSLAFTNLSLEAGLKRLLGRHNALFVYRPNGRLEELRVYPRVTGQLYPEPLQPGATPHAIAANEAIEASDDRLQLKLSDPEPAQRLAAATAFGRARDTGKAIGVLLDLLAAGIEPEIREKALATLKFFDAVPADPIAEVALFDPERSLSLEALETLGQGAARDPTAHTALRRVSKLALDATVREEARALLERREGEWER